jgi:predicted AlkP superfamily pyrophosphatase or phosphodiesterase
MNETTHAKINKDIFETMELDPLTDTSGKSDSFLFQVKDGNSWRARIYNSFCGSNVKQKESKKTCKILFGIVFLVSGIVILSVLLSEKALPKTLIVVSIDGFRNEYLSRSLTPEINAVGAEGVRAKYMQSQFPTLTFPNHYSIVTGLYPESHGIVGNTFYAPEFKEYFNYKNSSAKQDKWWGGEPIWATAQKQGKKCNVVFWPGSEAKIKDIRPTNYLNYSHAQEYSTVDRVDLALSYLDLKSQEKPDLILLYFSLVDQNGHKYGPDSSQVTEALKEINSGIGRLVKGIESRGLNSYTDLILVADHGMSKRGPPELSIMKLYDSISPKVVERLEVRSSAPLVMLQPRDPSEKENLFEILNSTSVGKPWKVFLKDKMPSKYNYGHNDRISDIIVLADNGFTVYTNSTAFDHYTMGTHGYDPFLEDMHTIFLAKGPSFKKGGIVENFEIVELYNLMSEILGISPAPNNGTNFEKIFAPHLNIRRSLNNSVLSP